MMVNVYKSINTIQSQSLALLSSSRMSLVASADHSPPHSLLWISCRRNNLESAPLTCSESPVQRWLWRDLLWSRFLRTTRMFLTDPAETPPDQRRSWPQWSLWWRRSIWWRSWPWLEPLEATVQLWQPRWEFRIQCYPGRGTQSLPPEVTSPGMPGAPPAPAGCVWGGSRCPGECGRWTCQRWTSPGSPSSPSETPPLMPRSMRPGGCHPQWCWRGRGQ